VDRFIKSDEPPGFDPESEFGSSLDFDATAEDIVREAISQGSILELIHELGMDTTAIGRQVRDSVTKRIAAIDDYTIDQIADQIEEGVRRGYSLLQIAGGVAEEEYAGISGVFDKASDYRSEMIARTETNWLFRDSVLSTYYQAGVTQVEAIDGDQWDSLCADRSGQIFPIEEAPDLAHPNCLVPGTLVTAAGIKLVTQRVHEGDVVTITTAHGNCLTATSNHPILTSQGWVLAGSLQEGDDVICALDADGVAALSGLNCPDDNYVHAGIEKIADFLFVSKAHLAPQVAHEANGTSNLNRDGRYVEIDVPLSDSKLRGHRLTLHRKEAGEGFLVRAIENAASLACQRTTSETRGVGGSDVAQPLVRAHAGTAHASGLAGSYLYSVAPQNGQDVPETTSIAIGDFLGSGEIEAHYVIHSDYGDMARIGVKTDLTQPGASNLDRDTSSLGDLSERLAAMVAADRIVKIELHPWRGHVYNLETDSGWYVAGGIITHNCTLVISPIVDDNVDWNNLGDDEGTASTAGFDDEAGLADAASAPVGENKVVITESVKRATIDAHTAMVERHARLGHVDAAKAHGRAARAVAEIEDIDQFISAMTLSSTAWEVTEKTFNEADHPRDSHGRFTTDGGLGPGPLDNRNAAEKVISAQAHAYAVDSRTLIDRQLAIIRDNMKGRWFADWKDGKNPFDRGGDSLHNMELQRIAENIARDISYGDLPRLSSDDSYGRILLKDAVCTDIAEKSGLSYERVDELTSAWAQSSSDTQRDSIALQQAASELWGSSPTPYIQNAINEMSSRTYEGGSWDDRVSDAKTYLNAVYDTTQERIKSYADSDGNVTLYRGVGIAQDQVDSVVGNGGIGMSRVAMNPISSWSLDPSIADGFGSTDYEHQSVVLAARVPSSSVISMSTTGIGCAPEREVVVKGPTTDVQMVTPMWIDLNGLPYIDSYNFVKSSSPIINIDDPLSNADWLIEIDKRKRGNDKAVAWDEALHPRNSRGEFSVGGDHGFSGMGMSLFTPDQQQKILDKQASLGVTPDSVQQNMTAIMERAKAAGDMETQRNWYGVQHDRIGALADQYHLDPQQATAVVAALSPQCEWERNLLMAEGVMKLTDHDPIIEITQDRADAINGFAGMKGEEPIEAGLTHVNDLTPAQAAYATQLNGLPSNLTKAFSLARGADIDETLSGPKVRSFFTNLDTPDRDGPATIDTHQVALMAGLDNEYSNAGTTRVDRLLNSTTINKVNASYAFYNDAVTKVADQYGLNSNEAQAVMWTQWNAEHPEPESSMRKHEALYTSLQTKVNNIP